MTRIPDDGLDPLGDSLAGLNAKGASPGFTARVIEELGTRRARRRRRQQLSVGALGIIAVAAVAVFSTIGRATDPAAADVAREAQELRAEYAQLESELQALRENARETAPVLYLGGDDEMDLVLDLAPIIMQSAPAAVPASGTRIDPYEL